jgi:DNA polymerase III sliding clamp (beta) subunit (PCNA family)
MNLTLDRAELFPVLDHVTKAVEGKTTIPILRNVLVATKPGQLCFRGTDLDVDIRETMAIPDMLANGAITVDGPMFRDIVK